MTTNDVQTLAFKMRLHPGMKAEYKKRHDEIWPELAGLLKEVGIFDYSIFLDEDTHALFAVFKCAKTFDDEALARQPVMKRWWDFMADIMEVHPNNQPVATPLISVFYLS